MAEPSHPSRYTYWKRPWQKGCVLAAGLLQCALLGMNLQETGELVKANVLSAAAWETYFSRQTVQCAENGVLIVLCFGTLLIGLLSRSPRDARLGESLLLLVTALLWGVAGWLLRLRTSAGVFWEVFLLLTLGGAGYSFWRYRREWGTAPDKVT